VRIAAEQTAAEQTLNLVVAQDLMHCRQQQEQQIAQEDELAERALDKAWNKVWEAEAEKDSTATKETTNADDQSTDESMTESQWILRELQGQRLEKERQRKNELQQREEQVRQMREHQQQRDEKRQEGEMREQEQFGQMRRQLEQQLDGRGRPDLGAVCQQDHVDLMKRKLEQLLEEERDLEYVNKEAMEACVTEVGSEFQAMRDMERGMKGQLATLHARLQELRMHLCEAVDPALSRLLQSRIKVIRRMCNCQYSSGECVCYCVDDCANGLMIVRTCCRPRRKSLARLLI
jgi:hypothetical protein